ncbi:hypothetical protein [Chryseobacterium profundimaris]|uniref:Uncharacterized protein n=1 Tax=Chryseobacterium profundimaris TaxID=1387275 RepID=A0ABY1NIG5_9FLAO|nr:hypothetical protein [Chryseobacterium profundimaris]SMP10461.1 hypothetical protein SAMN06264346_102209 [Chryseobacterium profundimaris]
MERRYDIAKNEYKSEDDNGRHRLVYAYFGLAIYFGQCLEETFSIMLWTDRIFRKRVKTKAEVNQILDTIENSKKTMGNFIAEVKQCYNLPNSIIDQLDKILSTRNYLAHKYFKLHIAKFYSEVGQLEMIEYFCDFIEESQHLDDQLKLYYKKYTDKLGITEERLEELMNQMKEEEINRIKK